MALSIKSAMPTRGRLLITTLIAVFALVAQPFYGMVQSQVASAVTGEVVYDTLMNTSTGQGYGSLSINSHRIHELGDRPLLGGSARQLEAVSFDMSSWTLREDQQLPLIGQWCDDTGACTEEGFIYPMTAKVYSGDLARTLGEVTQDIFIPWRPAGDSSCELTKNGPENNREHGWRVDGECVNISGIGFVASFDFSKEGLIVPNDAIYSISYNTRVSGSEPTGVQGPIDKVNVSLNGNTAAATVGQDYSTGHMYADYNTGSFVELPWGTPYNLGIRVVATTDGVAPEVKVNLDREKLVSTGAYVSQGKNPEIQASDETGLDRVELYKSGSDTPSHVWRHGDKSTRAKIGFLGDGQYTIVAHDKSGNASKPFVINLDSTDPETDIVAPEGLTGNKFTVSGEAKDNIALNRVYVQLVHRESNTRYGGTTINLIPHGTGPHTWERTYDATKMDLPEGTYAAHVSVVDRAGNSSSEGWTDDFTVDKTMPSFEIKSPKNGGVVSGKQRIEVEITDDNDIQKVLLNVGDGRGNYVWEHGKDNGKVKREGDIFYLDIDTNTLTEGVNHVVVRATDGAGNTRYYNNRKNLHSYTVDNTKPVLVNVTSDGKDIGNEVLSGSHDFQVNFEEDDLAKAHVEYMKREYNESKDEWKYKKKVGKLIKGQAHPVLSVNTRDWLDGEYRIKVTQITDRAGNAAKTQIVDFIVDNTKPTVAVDSPKSGATVSGQVEVRGTIEDANGLSHYFIKVTKQLENGKWEDVFKDTVDTNPDRNNDVLYTLPADSSGVYRVQLAARDLAGNRSGDVYSTFTVEEPEVTLEPSVFVDAFRVKPGHLLVEFTHEDISGAEVVRVDLWDGETQLASQTLAAALVESLVNNNEAPQISSPFYIPAQSDDAWIVDDSFEWTRDSQAPTLATVTILGQGGVELAKGELEFTDSDDIEDSGVTFASLIADILLPNGQGSDFQSRGTGVARITPPEEDEGSSIVSPFAQTATPFTLFGSLAGGSSESDADDEDGEVLGSRVENPRGSSEVLGAAVDTDLNESSGSIFGLAWYWWLVIVAALGSVAWAVAAAMRRRREDAELGF